MVNVTNVFDLETVLVYEVVGNLLLFVLLMLIVIYYVSNRFQIPFPAMLMLGALFLYIIAASFELELLYFVATTIIGFAFYFTLSEYIDRR